MVPKLICVLTVVALVCVCTACVSGRSCWLDRSQASEEIEYLVSRSTPIGTQLRVRGAYRGGFEGGRLAPAESFDEGFAPMGVEYCLQVETPCQRVIDRLESEARKKTWPLFLDAIVVYEGKDDPVQCPFGWLRIHRLIEAQARQ